MKRFFAGGILLVCVGAWWLSSVSAGTLAIESGDSVNSVAGKLKTAGIIQSATIFKIAFRVFGSGKHVYPGYIEIDDTCNLLCVMHKVTAVNDRSVRVVLTEGQDIHDLIDELTSKKISESAEILAITGRPATIGAVRFNFDEEFSFLKEVPKNISYEGYLFPDSYNFSQNADAESVVRTMLSNFDRRVTPQMRAAAKERGRTLFEVVTMASILEKEVRRPEEQRMVADILWRRLDKGMGLQVDSSVSYISQAKGVYTTKEQRASASLWNTYKYRGLPVGPIGNPGLAAIEAALSPKENNFWFYLTSPDGSVHYGRTLEEHVANKRFLR